MLKKTIAIGIILLFLFCNISFTTLSDENSGNLSGETLCVGGSGPGNYTKIQDAVDDASDGDTVFVYSGIYYETINVHKSIILQGQDKNSTIIDGKSTTGNIIEIRKSNTQIIGFAVRNANNNLGTGICIISSNNAILDNIITDVRYGIFFKGPWRLGFSNCIISNCIISRTDVGIYLEYVEKNKIYNNRILKNNDGIQLFDSADYNIINNNLFENNIRGIEFCLHFMLDMNRYNTITLNNFIRNYIGILFDGTNFYNNISYNNFIKNIISLTFFEHSYPALFPRNDINQNYWDRPRLLPKIIFGLKHFIIDFPWIQFDWHPANEPYDIPVPEAC